MTYSSFFQTVDEPVHIVRGMWWLQGAYISKCSNYGNPPLAQIAAAMPLYASGLRIAPSSPCSGDQGSVALQTRNLYERHLALARSGVLPFFVIASFVVWSWCHRLFGAVAALAAVFLLQGLPPVLAHAGLATTDMASAALIVVAMYVFSLWLEDPSLKRSAFLGVALGLALLAKLSALLFFPAGMVLVSVAWLADASHAGIERWSAVRRRFALLGVVSLLTFVVIWAGYRFSCIPLTTAADRPHKSLRMLGIDRLPSEPREFFFRILEMPIPAGGFVNSIQAVRTLNADGWPAYFMGEFRRTGWWYFFPALIALKSPLSFLILLLVGCGCLFLSGSAMPCWKRFAPILGAVGILLVSLTARINYGLRHVLSVYPLFAIVAGFGLATLVSARSVANPVEAARPGLDDMVCCRFSQGTPKLPHLLQRAFG